MPVQFQVRRGTTAQWSAAEALTPPVILAAGEFGYDIDTKILKIGDGGTKFSLLQSTTSLGVIPSGGSTGQGLIKSGAGLAWANYVPYPTSGSPDNNAAIVSNGSGGTKWLSGVGAGTLTGLNTTSPLTVNTIVGGSYNTGTATVGLDASALNTFLSNLSGTVAYATQATTANFVTQATTVNFATQATTVNFATAASSSSTINLGSLVSAGASVTSTVNINKAATNFVISDATYTSRITNISTGSLLSGGTNAEGDPYPTIYAAVNIGDINFPLNHTTTVYGKLTLPQWVSGALVTDANGLVGKQAVSSTNAVSTIVARDGSGNFAAGTITAGTITATTVNATTVNATTVTGACDAATLTGTINMARIAQNAITGGATGKIALATITNANILNATIEDSKLAEISTTGKVRNSATTATSANTVSAIVTRDASGNFSAGTITATTFNGSGSSLTAGSVPLSAINISSAAPLLAGHDTDVAAGTENLIVIDADNANVTINLTAVAANGRTITIVKHTLGDVYSNSSNIVSRTGAVSATICSGPGSWATLVYRTASLGAFPTARWYVMAGS